MSLVAHSIEHAYRQFLPPVDRIYLCGGGAHHPLILQELQALLGAEKVKVFDELGTIPSDAKEAAAFAVLAHERLNGAKTNVPSVTGAKQGVSLGKISIPTG